MLCNHLILVPYDSISADLLSASEFAAEVVRRVESSDPALCLFHLRGGIASIEETTSPAEGYMQRTVTITYTAEPAPRVFYELQRAGTRHFIVIAEPSGSTYHNSGFSHEGWEERGVGLAADGSSAFFADSKADRHAVYGMPSFPCVMEMTQTDDSATITLTLTTAA